MSDFKKIDGGITAAGGFKASGIHCGLKKSAPDMAILYSEFPAVLAAAFTTNRICAAPVKLCRQRLSAGTPVQAVVINSGNANACTGQPGMDAAKATVDMAAAELGIEDSAVLVCSTGCIGIPMPMAKIENGVKLAAAALEEDGGDAAAKAIMTTDTTDKQIAVEISIGGQQVKIGGMAKGSGMIEPNMATLLAFIATDAAVEPEALQECVTAAVKESFNRITVDGDQSTNDTLICLANGSADNTPLNISHPDWQTFADGIAFVAKELAMLIVKDGEGATKFVTVVVEGARTEADASLATRAIANSLLVKTSWFGQDPNWGRIADAVGYSGADVEESLLDISFDDVATVRNGMAVDTDVAAVLTEILKQKCFAVRVNLNLGDAVDTVFTCDCSHEYVSINADYTT
jgi:glutamate N-acetyltransferase/amino-acid N-acetyltransferase